MIAKENGSVRFSDINSKIEEYYGFKWAVASGYNCNTSIARAIRNNQTMADYIREMWNTPNNGRSPYKYFGGVLVPVGLDEHNDVVYEYQGDKID